MLLEAATAGLLEKRCSKFTGKHQCQSRFNFIKKETVAQVFFCAFYKISKNTFSTEHFQTRVDHLLVHWYQHVPKCISCHKAIVTTHGGHSEGHIVFMITYILCPSCFCKIWALCVSWTTYVYIQKYIYIYIYTYICIYIYMYIYI